MKTENDALRERIEQLKIDLANEKIRCAELISENERKLKSGYQHGI